MHARRFAMSLIFHHVFFSYNGATPLFEDITAHFATGWTGIVGPNGAGKSTLLHLALGLLEPVQGSIKRSGDVVFCPQRTDDAPELLPELLAAADGDAYALRGRLQIGDDWAARWSSLSHGERKRAQIAVALWQRPGILLVDEPTNHIDIEAHALLVNALAAFRGVGLLVSHDRALLDGLCRQCLFLDPPGAVMRPGGYTEAAAQERQEEESARDRQQVLEQEVKRLTGESKRRRAKAGRADRRRSKRNLARGDSDGRAKINLVRVSGKDGQDGRLARQLDGRIAQVQDSLADITVKKRYPASFWLEGSTSPRRRLISLPACEIGLDGTRRLEVPGFSMLRDERVAITGANGLGKSTFLRHVLRSLNLEQDRLVYLPQEIDLNKTREIMAAMHRLSSEQLGNVMTVVSALGSRPERLLRNLDASPGELRKVLLALGVIRRPHLIIMDEPTNHLDLPAIECLENALAQCPCGLLLVSHDMGFLSRVAVTRWHLEQNGETVAMRRDDAFRGSGGERLTITAAADSGGQR
ncbi:ABC transporter ATP-binding protein [Oceanidesulfovibrio marinus]|uniref:ABC transporter ATP-binding protein n=2 Tax=Oceanidesulfovibrio marinus TaxID=370038 RepID=A0A6P1ZPQ5_9BACT|nr:ABC transporter ATP-binding protein [Oceanidesulfovibrio marinus]